MERMALGLAHGVAHAEHDAAERESHASPRAVTWMVCVAGGGGEAT